MVNAPFGLGPQEALLKVVKKVEAVALYGVNQLAVWIVGRIGFSARGGKQQSAAMRQAVKGRARFFIKAPFLLFY